VNGVLRASLRRGLEPLPPGGADDLPPWIAHAWSAAWGAEAVPRTEALLREAHLGLRRRPPQGGAAVEWARPAWPGCDELLVADAALGPPDGLPGFQLGHWAIQDAGSVLVADLLELQPGACVVDLCAAPGGKSLLFADRVGQGGLVLAADLDPERMGALPAGGGDAAEIRHRALDLTEPVAVDRFRQELPDGAGRWVFVDAPCSSLGTVRRHPEILWLRRPSDLRAMARRQARILDSAAGLVSPGGRLVYAVCTPGEVEGGEVVRAFLERHPHFRLGTAELRAGAPIRRRSDGLFETLPERAPCDAFQAAVLERRT
jgi:16S rRNA (cytosine967-C5)-methyltransferase